MTKLIIVIGIVAALYGGVVIVSAATKIDAIRQECLAGQIKDEYSSRQPSVNVNQVCYQHARSQYGKDIKPGLLITGISFISIAIAFFVRTFRNASVLLYTLEMVLLLLGVWLIKTDL